MEIAYLPTEKIFTEEKHPIKQMEDTMYRNLKDSIKESGILVPLIVHQQKDKYYILDGRHRLKVAKELKIPTVPCKILHNANPRDLINNMYDPELYRKTYDANEIERFQKQKEEEIQEKEKLLMSELLNNLPPDLKQKLGIDSNVNSLAKLSKAIFTIEGSISTELEKIKQERDNLKAEKEKLELKIKEQEEKITNLEIDVDEQIEKYKSKIQEEIDKKVKERLELEKKKLSEIDQANIEKINKLRNEIRKEVVEELNNLYKEKISTLQNEQKELQKKLQETLVQLNNTKLNLKNKEEKIKELEHIKAEKDRINQNLQATLEKLTEKSSMIRKAEIALNEVTLTEGRIAVALKELNDLHIYLSSIDASNTQIEKPDLTTLKNLLEKIKKKVTLLLEDVLPQLK